MNSVSYAEFGDPTRVLTLVERVLPAPGPGEVRVKMVLSPIHNHDLATIAGTYGIKPELPAVPGTEAVGIVDALGAGVSNLAVGQRVMGGAGQTWAQYYVVNASRAIPVPDSVDDATACQLISMPFSAKLLLADLHVKAGDWIIQNAANGAVGKLVAQFGAERGVNVINLVRRDAAIAEMAALGIAHVVSTEAPDWQSKVAAITGGAPISRGLDSIGGDGPEALLGVAGEGAQIISFGNLSGRPIRLSAENLLFKQASVRGFWAARPRATPEAMGGMIGELVQAAASGRLELPLEAVFELADAKDAARASGTPGRKGKIALRG